MTARSADRPLGLTDVVLRVAIVGLTLGTAYIHSTLGGLLFTLNAAGYLVAAVAIVIPLALAVRFRWFVRLGLIGYAAATIVGWAIQGPYYSTAYIAKAIEVALIILLAIDFVRMDGNPISVVKSELALLGAAASAAAGDRLGRRLTSDHHIQFATSDQRRYNPMKRLVLTLGLLVLAVVAIACSPASGASPPASTGPVDPNAPVDRRQEQRLRPGDGQRHGRQGLQPDARQPGRRAAQRRDLQGPSASREDLDRRDRQLKTATKSGPGTRGRPVLLPVRRAQGDEGHDRRRLTSVTTTAPAHARAFECRVGCR